MEKGIFRDLKDTFFDLVKGLFGKRSDLMIDLNVQKGFLVGFKYLIFIVILLPLKVLTVLINPNWKMVKIVERLTLPFLSLLYSVGGSSANPFVIVASAFERYVKHVLSGASSEIYADLSNGEAILNLFKIKKVFSLSVVCMLLVVASMIMIDVLMGSMLTWAISSFSAFWVVAQFKLSLSVIFGLIGLIGFFLLWLVGFCYIAFYAILILKICLEIYNCLVFVRKDEFDEFLNELLAFSSVKTAEIYGEEVATKALSAMHENFGFKSDINADLRISHLKKELENERN